jgi:hypothetical protein
VEAAAAARERERLELDPVENRDGRTISNIVWTYLTNQREA